VESPTLSVISVRATELELNIIADIFRA